MCPLPAPGAPQGTLSVHEAHEFGSDYDVLSVTYYLDGCIVYRTTDRALLHQPKLDMKPREVPAGARQLRYAIEFQSGFSADMHGYTWSTVGELSLEVREGGTTTVTLRMFEDPQADPRKRMRVVAQVGVDG